MPKRKLILLIVTLVGLSLVACTRSATSAGEPTPTLDDIASVYFMRGTLTAQAPDSADDLDGTQPADGETGDSPLFAPTATTSLAVTATPTQLFTPAPTQPQSIPTTYTLHDGEYPYCIARRFDVDITALLAASGLTEEDLYGIGTVLTIPSDAPPFLGERSLLPHPTQYTVLANDTFYSIACKFGDVFPEAIAQANGMEVDAVLTTGQVIQIP